MHALHKFSAKASLVGKYKTQFLPMILRHISEPIPDTLNQPSSAIRLSRSYHSLEILRWLLVSFSPYPHPEVYNFCVKHWPLIWAWLSFFLEEVVVKKARLRDNLGYHPPANFDLRDSIWTSSIGTIRSLITSLPKISPKYNPDILLATIPRFVPIITCVWIIATESHHETMIPITAILESLLSTTSYPGELGRRSSQTPSTSRLWT